jgi:hypothetical protein
MLAIVHLLGTYVANLFKSRRRLEAENLFLRHQLNVALRHRPPRLRLRGSDRALLVWMTRLWPSLLGLARIVEPATILRWHRAGFRTYWRWKSRGRAGRPRIERELRDLIRRMNRKNSLWGAPRIRQPVRENRASAGLADRDTTAWLGPLAQLFWLLRPVHRVVLHLGPLRYN